MNKLSLLLALVLGLSVDAYAQKTSKSAKPKGGKVAATTTTGTAASGTTTTDPAASAPAAVKSAPGGDKRRAGDWSKMPQGHLNCPPPTSCRFCPSGQCHPSSSNCTSCKVLPTCHSCNWSDTFYNPQTEMKE